MVRNFFLFISIIQSFHRCYLLFHDIFRASHFDIAPEKKVTESSKKVLQDANVKDIIHVLAGNSSGNCRASLPPPCKDIIHPLLIYVWRLPLFHRKISAGSMDGNDRWVDISIQRCVCLHTCENMKTSKVGNSWGVLVCLADSVLNVVHLASETVVISVLFPRTYRLEHATTTGMRRNDEHFGGRELFGRGVVAR